MTFEEKKQLYIIKQSCLNRACDMHSKDDNWNEDQILKLADTFVEWVYGGESNKVSNSLPDLTPISDLKKVWCNEGSKEFFEVLELMSKGYSVAECRKQYKISNDMKKTLEDELQSKKNI
tara:strand:+ start:163 stop:522 length:360 start_codon:yes stop_codon:yes gene_type:complete